MMPGIAGGDNRDDSYNDNYNDAARKGGRCCRRRKPREAIASLQPRWLIVAGRQAL
jgi:hypothetical protein